MKDGKTKKERLAEYKLKKAEEKHHKALLMELCKLLSEEGNFLSVSNYFEAFIHDCMVVPKEFDGRIDEIFKELGSKMLKWAPGRLTFGVQHFFEYAKKENPYLLNILPEPLLEAYKQDLIGFVLHEMPNQSKIHQSAYFDILYYGE